MSDLVQRLERRIRRHVLAEMPEDPSKELASKSLPDLLLIYGNWRSRLIAAIPRSAHESSELRVSPAYRRHAPVLDAIKHKISAGEDLTTHLSRGVKVAYEPEGLAPEELKRRRDRDLLIADWGMHHLHLSTSLENA